MKSKNERVLSAMTKSHDRALSAFITNSAEITIQLETLKNYCDNHMEFNPDEINWSHVGTSGHVLELLAEINEFLGLSR
jgi:helix-turn-helix protein